MLEILTRLSDVVCMMDDTLVYGSTSKEHDTCLRDVLHQLLTAGMTLNESKFPNTS